MEAAAHHRKETGVKPLELHILSVSRSQQSPLAKIEILVKNRSTESVLINSRPSAIETGLPREQQIFVGINIPRRPSGRGRTYDVVPVRPDSYVILEPHHERVLATSIDLTDMVVGENRVRLDLCFWDRNPNIPESAHVAAAFRGPISVSEVVSISN
jgi:hypothetical protein